MKKITITLITLFLVVGAFAQEKSMYNQSLDKLLKAKNSSAIFDNILKDNIQNLTPAQQDVLRTKVEASKQKIQAEAIAYFTKKYSQEDLNEIYSEFTTPGRVDYSTKTLSFLREWRSFKSKFQKEFKELYMDVQR